MRGGALAENGAAPQPADAVSTAKCAAADRGVAPSAPNQQENGDAGRPRPGATGRGIPEAMRWAVSERDQGRCSYGRCVGPTALHLLPSASDRPYPTLGEGRQHRAGQAPLALSCASSASACRTDVPRTWAS